MFVEDGSLMTPKINWTTFKTPKTFPIFERNPSVSHLDFSGLMPGKSNTGLLELPDSLRSPALCAREIDSSLNLGPQGCAPERGWCMSCRDERNKPKHNETLIRLIVVATLIYLYIEKSNVLMLVFTYK